MTETFDQWPRLQQCLREEYVLSVSEAQAKNTLQKKLTSIIISYHNNYIQLLQERDGKPGEPEKKILKDEGFGDAYTFAKESILTICKDFRLVLELIKRNNDYPTEQWNSLSKLIVNSLFENLVEQQIYNKDIMFLMVDVLDIIIAGHGRAADINFLERSVAARVLKEFTQRQEIKRYSQAVLRNTILAIAKVDESLDLNMNKPRQLRMSKELSRQDKPLVVAKQASTALTSRQSPNYTKLYSEIFKQYDQRKGWGDKDSCYMSRSLLKYLGVSEQSSYPTFTTKRARRNNLENEINLKFNKMLEVNEAFEKEHRLDPDLEDKLCKLRNIINTFFASVFKNLYNMPMAVRVFCKAIQLMVMKRFPNTNRTIVLQSVASFLFAAWMLPEIYYEDKILVSGIISDDHKKNALQIQQMLQRVIRGQYLTQDVPHKREVNKIIRHLHGSVQNYLEEVLNVSEAQVRRLLDKQRDQRICSFSACLSFEDMRVLFELFLEAKDQIQPINDKLINRITRVKDMTDDFAVLKGRQDRQDNKFYGSQQAYVLFTELILPKYLQADYYKQYVETYRNDKQKNLLRQVLVSMDKLELREPMREHLQKLVNKYKYRKELHSLDKLPLDIRIKYLLSISTSELESLGQQLLSEYDNRIKQLSYTFNQTKSEFLRAEDNVKRYEQEVAELQKKHSQIRKKRLLNEFIERTKVSICLTSPKTREGQIAMRSNSIKNLGPEKEKIWLEFQNTCIHTTLNLQFIKSLTGEPDRKKKDEVGHCSTIRKFIDVFSGLPEVKTALLTGNDTYGIKATFYDFIKYCVDLAKAQPKETQELLDDEQWFEDQLERMLTLRVYERIYPKGQTYDDAAVYFRMKTLDWIQFTHLNIKESNRVDGLWRLAARQLSEIDQFKTPNQKLECIHSCTQSMTNILSLTSQKDETASADTTYPIMVYILLKACPRRLVSNLNFIELFSNSNKMMSQVGYCFIQIKSAITFFEILNETKIHNISRLDYEKKIYERQNEYGVYFLKRRPRCEKNELNMEPLRLMIQEYLKQDVH